MRSLSTRVLETFIPRDVIGFCYHTVSDRQLPHVESLYRCKSVAQFRRDLEFLRRAYRVVSYAELERSRAARVHGKPCVVITFDDGLVECYDVIRPVLLELGLPAIFFVTTEFLDNRRLFYRQKVALCIEACSRLTPSEAAAVRADVARYFGATSGGATPAGATIDSAAQLEARLQAATWSEEAAIDATCTRLGIDTAEYLRTARPYLTRAQVHALVADGFTIGAHGTSHQKLGTMKEPEARAEIAAACGAVAELAPAAVVPFAFPFNGRGVSRAMMRTLRESDPQVGLFFDSTELASEPAFVVNRLVVDDPAGASESRSNLPRRIDRAYAREIVRPLIGSRARSSSR